MDKKVEQEHNAESDIAEYSEVGSRLRSYRRAVRSMRRGVFRPEFFNDPEQDDLAALGRELKDLGRWIDSRFSELRKLQQTAESIASGASLDELLDGIWNAFRTLIPYDRIGCAFIEHGTQVTAYWARGDTEDAKLRRGFSAKLAGSSLQTVIETGQPRIINDLEAYYAEHPKSASTPLVLEEGIRSSLTCPLVAHGSPIGFLFFSSRKRNTYRRAHREVFVQIAGLVSTLVEKTRLYQEILELNHQLIAAQQAMKELAIRDGLTCLLNRRAIAEFLEATLAQAKRQRQEVALVMVDIDHFKLVNDTHGHLAGDAVLRAVAHILKDGLRPYDGLGRFGGEEFVIVLAETPLALASSIAERLGHLVASTPIKVGDVSISVTVSQGLAMAQDISQLSSETLLARADSALYAAKHSGRNRVFTAP